MQAKKASWTESDLARAINDALPDYLGGLNAADVHALLDGLTAQAIASGSVRLTATAPGEDTLPAELRLADGRSAYEPAGSRLYATVEQVNAERSLRAAAAERGAPVATADAANAYLEGLAAAGLELGADQAAAVRGILTSGARVEALVGPAGTGKSFVVGALAEAWQNPALFDGRQQRVIGLASSQIATEVLAGEGLTASNIARWLAAQQRLTDGTPLEADQQWALSDGDLVVVDESAMASTADLTAIRRHADTAGAKLLLTGDHRQLAAVGAAGGMELVSSVGITHQLAEVRRFTHAWERDASLRLREGDPAALMDYRKHGRILDSGTVEQAQAAAARAWLADTLAGRDSLLIVDTNEAAARVCAGIRADLVRLGKVTEDGVPLALQGTFAGVGDLVQARRNAWQLAGHEDNRRGPINRERYRVLQTREDGGLVVTTDLTGDGLGERVVLPADYVAEHVALGYASTVHSAQGLTVDTCHTVTTSATGPAALYVGLSRGRHANTAYVTTLAVAGDDPPPGLLRDVERRDPLAVLQGCPERNDPERAAIAEAADSAAEAGSLRTVAERFADVAELAAAGRVAVLLDRLHHEGKLTQDQRYALAIDEGMPTLARLLRQAEVAGHDPGAVLTAAVDMRRLDDARSIATVLHHRISEAVTLEPTGDSWRDWIPTADDPAFARHLTDLAAAADRRIGELGATIANEPPQWAVEALGEVPELAAARREWEHRAGVVAAHRELAGHDDPAAALPGPPKPGQVEAYASWRAAWKALGRPEADRAEAEMSDGRLRVRVRAYEREKAWEPRFVAHELAGTAQAEARHRQTAQLRAGEAESAADTAQRDRLIREAAEATALADVLAEQRAQLEEADRVRGLWYAHTAETRANAHRARAELATRGIDPDRPENATTAEEWLVAHGEADRADDTERVISRVTELADVAAQRDADLATVADDGPVVEPPAPDVRQAAGAEPRGVEPDTREWTAVPSAKETADAVARARRALLELERRQAEEAVHTAEEARTAELGRWRDDDLVAEQQTGRELALEPDRTS